MSNLLLSLLLLGPSWHFAVLASASNNCEWTQIGNTLSLPANETANGDVDFGFSVDLSDNMVLAVGGYQFNESRGMMRIFSLDNDDTSTSNGNNNNNATSATWELLGTETTGEVSGQRLGWNVAVSADGGTVAVGSDYNTGSGVGEVRVFSVGQYFDDFVYPLGQPLLTENGDVGSLPQQRFGHTVSLSADGRALAVGSAQSAHLFRLDDDSQWFLAANFTDPQDRVYGTLTVSLSADGDTMALGQSRFEVPGGDTGAGRVRVVQGLLSDDESSWTWSEPSDPDNNNARILHFVLSASGDALAVMTLSEVVRVYRYVDVAKSWIPQGQDLSGIFGGDHGDALSLSANGTVLAVGADDNDGGTGYARVYSFLSGSWHRLGSDILGDGPGSEFGDSVGEPASFPF